MRKYLLLVILLLCPLTARATSTEISTAATNVGIGTNSQKNALSVRSTLAVGDASYTSTTVQSGGAIIQGNVGIGTLAPAQVLDVAGTVRAQAFSGTSTGVSYTTGNLGVGTTTPQAAFVVTVGNVGIATWTAATAALDTPSFRLRTSPTAGNVLVSGSTGIGTWMSPTSIGAGSGSGTVNSGTISRAAVYASAGTTLSSSTKLFDDGTNVGIGTIAPRTAVELGVQALNIVGSNVGIGSITPGQVLDVNGAIRSIAAGNSTIGGNLGIGTTTPPQALYVVGTTQSTVAFKAAGNVGINTTLKPSNVTNCVITGGLITTWN